MNTRPDDPFDTSPLPAQTPRERLEALLRLPEEDCDLAEAALLLAAGHYPRLDIPRYVSLLDEVAREARRRIGRIRRPQRILEILNTLLFEEMGFQGNRENYYTASNSFLHTVLDTRQGLPITLATVYLAITHRLRLPVYGVGMPYHFLVKFAASERDLYVDCFNGGTILMAEECEHLLERIVGQPIVFEPQFLQVTPKKQILYRMLNNLKQVYLRNGELTRAGTVIEQMLVVSPESNGERRNLGMLALHQNQYSQGISWLLDYLERAPNAPDVEAVRQAIQHAAERRARLN